MSTGACQILQKYCILRESDTGAASEIGQFSLPKFKCGYLTSKSSKESILKIA